MRSNITLTYEKGSASWSPTLWAWAILFLCEIIWLLCSKYCLIFSEGPSMNISQINKYVCVYLNITISPGQMTLRKGLWGKALSQKRRTCYFFTDVNPPRFRLLFPLLWTAFLAELLAKGPHAFEEPISPPHLSPNPYSESLSLPSSSLSSTITWKERPWNKMMQTIAHLLDWTSLNRSHGCRFSSTKVNCSFRMTSLLHLKQE